MNQTRFLIQRVLPKVSNGQMFKIQSSGLLRIGQILDARSGPSMSGLRPRSRGLTTTSTSPTRPTQVDFGQSATAPPVTAASSLGKEPQVVSSSSASAVVKLRDGAVRKLRELEDSHQECVLRLTVKSGGCSGYSYAFSLERPSEPASGEVLIERDGARFVIDDVSLSFMQDCEIDYVEEMIRASFQVVQNKLADSKCGCGSSFSVNF